MISNNKDDYIKEAIVRARKHLMQAELPSIRIANCRRKLLAAKKELRQGKK